VPKWRCGNSAFPISETTDFRVLSLSARESAEGCASAPSRITQRILLVTGVLARARPRRCAGGHGLGSGGQFPIRLLDRLLETERGSAALIRHAAGDRFRHPHARVRSRKTIELVKGLSNGPACRSRPCSSIAPAPNWSAATTGRAAAIR
jgi:hypothetical protein